MKVLKKKTPVLKIRKSNKNTLPLHEYKKECEIRSLDKHNIYIYIKRDIDSAEPLIHIEPIDPKKPFPSPSGDYLI